MATDFPGGYDLFTEPSLPDETPLAQAGTGNRNHYQHHRDLGDAVEALQRNTSLKDHDHSGTDPLNPSSKLKQVNTHQDPDTDVSNSSIHHTLGTGQFQAAPGNHVHDYNSASIINKPYILCTSTTRPGSPSLGMQIYETDTNRVRVWSQFLDNQTVTGLNSRDDFNRTSASNLGDTLWEQWYQSGGELNGLMATPSGTAASWIDNGATDNRCIARRINSPDAVTQTDDQAITWFVGDTPIEGTLPFTNDAANDFYFRMSPDRQIYVRLAVFNGRLQLFTTNSGPAGEVPLGTLNNINTATPNTGWAALLKDRTWSFFKGGVPIGSLIDTSMISSRGSGVRGWGIGMTAGARVFGQTTPSNIDWVQIQDLDYYQTVNRWTLLPVASRPIVRLRQGTGQAIPVAGALVEWRTELEDNFNYFSSAASMTNIIIKEPGLYQVDSCVQWAPDIFGDWGFIVVCINGVETTVRNQEFVSGGFLTLGYSQSVGLSSLVRFNTNDILSIKVKHDKDWEFWTFSNIPGKIDSRLDITYISP